MLLSAFFGRGWLRNKGQNGWGKPFGTSTVLPASEVYPCRQLLTPAAQFWLLLFACLFFLLLVTLQNTLQGACLHLRDLPLWQENKRRTELLSWRSAFVLLPGDFGLPVVPVPLG